jgi:hypothetical protein
MGKTCAKNYNSRRRKEARFLSIFTRSYKARTNTLQGGRGFYFCIHWSDLLLQQLKITN